MFEYDAAPPDRREKPAPARDRLLGEVHLRPRHRSSQAERHDLHLLRRLAVSVKTAVRSIEQSSHRIDCDLATFIKRDRNGQLEILANVARLDRAAERNVSRRQAATSNDVHRASFERSEDVAHLRAQPGDAFAQDAGLTDVDLRVFRQYAHCAKHTGARWHEHIHAELARDIRRMQRSGTAEGDENEIGRIKPALYRNKTDRLRNVGVGDCEDGGGRFRYADLLWRGDIVFDRF